MLAQYAAGMPAQRSRPPGWAVGGISQLVGYVIAHANTPEDTDRVIRQMEPAVPVWRTDIPRYAEHFGCYSDVLLNRYLDDGDSVKLDRSGALCREASDAPGLDGLVRSRLRMQQIKIDIEIG